MDGRSVAELPCGLDLQHLAIICSFVCLCEQSPIKKKGNNKEYKQLCFDIGLDLYSKAVPCSPFVTEVPYIVNSQTAQAVPVFDHINSPRKGMYKTAMLSARIAAAITKKDDIDDFIEKNAYYSVKAFGDAKKKDLLSYGKLRRPDVIIMKDPSTGSLKTKNIRKVVEIKFPGDRYRGSKNLTNNGKIPGKYKTTQERDSIIIAGNDPSKLKTVTINEPCWCKGKDQNVKGVNPTFQPAKIFEKDIQLQSYKMGIPQDLPSEIPPLSESSKIINKGNESLLAMTASATIGIALARFAPVLLTQQQAGTLLGIGVPLDKQIPPEL